MPAMNTLVQTFIPVHRPWEPQCTASQIDEQMDHMVMPIFD